MLSFLKKQPNICGAIFYKCDVARIVILQKKVMLEWDNAMHSSDVDGLLGHLHTSLIHIRNIDAKHKGLLGDRWSLEYWQF